MDTPFGVLDRATCTTEFTGRHDLAIVRAMALLGSALDIFGLLLTDISYTLFDPRIRL